jgi:hypothetical protein
VQAGLGSGTVSTNSAPVPPRGTASRVAAGVVGLQALALVVFAVFYLVELFSGGGGDPARVLSSVVLLAVFAVGLIVLARGLLAGHPSVRTPTVVWELLLLPVGVTLVQSGQAVIGVLVLVASVVCLLAVALRRRPEA